MNKSKMASSTECPNASPLRRGERTNLSPDDLDMRERDTRRAMLRTAGLAAAASLFIQPQAPPKARVKSSYPPLCITRRGIAPKLTWRARTSSSRRKEELQFGAMPWTVGDAE